MKIMSRLFSCLLLFFCFSLAIGGCEAFMGEDGAPGEDGKNGPVGLDGTTGKENGRGDDPDGDGVTNFEEFSYGSDPLDPASRRLIASAIADA